MSEKCLNHGLDGLRDNGDYGMVLSSENPDHGLDGLRDNTDYGMVLSSKNLCNLKIRQNP
ncbi:MAG: hypothetical protein VKN72_14415 [Nostocales cyanobacterium 94392]|nr:hypothetical protein [Nostocales cyanobacterium 94392]